MQSESVINWIRVLYQNDQIEVNYLGTLFRLKEFSMKNDRLMIKQPEMHDAICVTGSLLCMRAWLHTYACSSWQRRPVCLVSVQHINPRVLRGSDHCLFPQLFAQPFSVLTALLLPRTCLPSWLPGTQKCAACWRALLRSQASRERRPALNRSLTSHSWETTQKQLQVRWLFHVFISQRWSINLDWHSLEYILCVLLRVYVCFL